MDPPDTITGNTSIAVYKSQQDNGSFMPLRNIHYGVLISPNNPGLKWERQKIINGGIEIGLLDSKISAILEAYSKKGIDLMGPIQTDPTSGFIQFFGNFASIKLTVLT